MATSPGTSDPARASSAPAASVQGPLIPLDYCDAPNQRFYAISLLALQQSYKLFQFAESYLPSSPPSQSTLLLKWAIYDIVTLYFILPGLRIPMLDFPKRNRLAIVAFVLFLNWLFVGDWRVADLFRVLGALLPSSLTSFFQFDLAISEHRVRLHSLIDPASHILGSHTIHILPHSTARFLLPSGEGNLQTTQLHHCVSTDESSIFMQNRVTSLPILLNNTSPQYLQYSLQSFGESEKQYFNLTAKDLVQVVSHRGWNKQHKRLSLSFLDDDDDDEAETLHAQEEYDFASSGTIGQRLIGYDGATNSDGATGDVTTSTSHHSIISNYLKKTTLQKTQSIWIFNVNKPGIVRIERVIDKSSNDVRIPNPNSDKSKVVIVPCPNAAFAKSSLDTSSKVQSACQGDQPQAVDLSVDIFGYPPLKLSYHRAIGSAKDTYTIDGIAPEGTVLLPHLQKTGSANTKRPSQATQQQLDQHAMLMNTQEANVQPFSINVPLNVSLSTPGTQHYTLDRVTDSFGNVLDFGSLRERYTSPSGPSSSGLPSKSGSTLPFIKSGARTPGLKQQVETSSSRRVLVYPRSQVNFFGCGTGNLGASAAGSSAGSPVKLLQGKTANLQLRVASSAAGANVGSIPEDSPWSAKVRFEPETSGEDDLAVSKTRGWTKEVKLGRKQEFFPVTEAGRYSIVGLEGSKCAGDVLEPAECQVYTPPLPFVDVTMEPITDSCAGEVGLRTAFSLSGEPPYRVHYTVQRGTDTPVKKTKIVRLSRDELELRPEQVGDFTYKFLSLDDNNYNDIKIDQTYRQTVHPLAGVQFSERTKEKNVWSCENTDSEQESVKVPVDLKGIAPWRVDYRIVGQKDVVSVEDIKSALYDLNVKIPSKIQKAGGSFTLSIVRVQDGRGCSQPLTVDDLVVNVYRTKPTAAFTSSKKVVVKQGETVPIGLRLTGEGPWKVAYKHPSGKPRTVTIKSPMGQILVDQAGHYELVSVSDAHCPGSISSSSKTYEIEWIAKPTVQLASDAGKLAKNGSLIRAPVCEGVDDAAAVIFTGHSPYVVSYEIIEQGKDGQAQRSLQDLQSIQKRAQFELSTTTPGHRVYQFTGLGDSVYTALSRDGLKASAGSTKPQVLRLEQNVLARPSIMFLERDRKPVYCVKDSLDHKALHSPSLRLTGVPPFKVELEIIPDGSHMSQRYSDVVVKSHNWNLELPHIFSEPGDYTIYIRKIVDATGCSRKITKGTKGTFTTLEVADTASINALQAQTDHCVGDTIDFVLQGSSPWTVVYDFNGKKITVNSKESRFSRVAEAPGTFAIDSVSQSLITDIKKDIHRLPSAKVKSGSSYIENIREGDQAEIVFEFEGTPPFTFTYTKSEAVISKNRKPKVIETHTITGVTSHTYSIYTQSEGTWAVTSVSDAFCSYPPLARSDRKFIKEK